jgi:hypothetical protein
MDSTPSAISLRAVVTAALALTALLAVGVLTLGLGGGAPAAAAQATTTTTAGCTTGPFAYDAAEARRQQAFESRLDQGATLPPFGFYTDAPDETATLHAASHSWVVVFYRPGVDTTALRTLTEEAVALKIPLLAAPRRQKPAFVAVTQNEQLTCSGASADAVRAFAAARYPDLAE